MTAGTIPQVHLPMHENMCMNGNPCLLPSEQAQLDCLSYYQLNAKSSGTDNLMGWAMEPQDLHTLRPHLTSSKQL